MDNIRNFFWEVREEIKRQAGVEIPVNLENDEIFGKTLPIETARVYQAWSWLVISLFGFNGPASFHMDGMNWDNPGRVVFLLNRVVDETLRNRVAKGSITKEKIWENVFSGFCTAYLTGRLSDFLDDIVKMPDSIFEMLAA